MAQTYNLDNVVSKLSYPVTGRDVIDACERNNFPDTFMNEFRPLIKNQNFDSESDLHDWLADNLTAHMAGLLGGASVSDLIRKGKKAA